MATLGMRRVWLQKALRSRLPTQSALVDSVASLGPFGLQRAFSSIAQGVRPTGPTSAWLPSVRAFLPIVNPQLGRSIGVGNMRSSAALVRRASTQATAAQLRSAENRANRYPQDVRLQAVYCELLNSSGMSSEVVRRFESQKFAADDAVKDEYVRALVATGVLRANETGAVLQSLGYGGSSHYPSQFSYASQPDASHSTSPYGQSSGSFMNAPRNSHPGNHSSPYNASIPSSSQAYQPQQAILGTEHNPIIFRQQIYRNKWADYLNVFSKLTMIALALTIAYQFFGKKNGMNPLENLTGTPITDTGDVPDTRFEDVKGVDEAKEELHEVVKYLRHPEKYQRLGARIPKGVLLTGPPGTGKTLLARAVAGEAGVKFYSKSASEFEEMLVGLGAKRVRELFDVAKQNAPAIVFIDEIDAMGAKRRNINIGGNSERQTLNQLLACMDGFDKNDNVVVVAATNDPDSLDNALKRPGRFDSQVPVPRPDMKGRTELFKYYLSKVKVSNDVSAELLAKQTPGNTGADIAALVNSAAIMAAGRGAEFIELRDLEEARDKQMMGPGLRSRKKTKEQLKLTAYHEAGHTVVNLFTDGAPELHKVTVLSRGQSGGATYYFPKDEGGATRKEILAKIDLAFGGMVAEEYINGFENLSTGPMGDLQSASDLARQYVKFFGMSRLGFAQYTGGDYNNPDGRPSESTRAKIDEEVEIILRDSYERAKSCIMAHKRELEYLARALMEHESLSADEVRRVIKGEKLPLTPEQLKAKEKERELKNKKSSAASGDRNSGDDPKRGWGLFGGFKSAPTGESDVKSAPAPQSPSRQQQPTPNDDGNGDSSPKREDGKRRWV